MVAHVPDNWAFVEIGRLCTLTNGRAFKPSEWSNSGLPIVRIQNLRSKQAQYNYFAGEVADQHRIDNGSLLFAWSGTPGTSFGAHRWEGGPAVLNQHIFRVDCHDELVHPKYLQIALNWRLPHLIRLAKGAAGLKHLTKSAIETTAIPLPPRAEQDRIVSLLDDLIPPLLAADETLKMLWDSAVRLKRSILSAAVRGDLSLDARGAATAPAPNRREQDVPPEWALRTVSAVGEVRLGRQRSPKYHSGSQMRPYLRVANVLEDCINTADIMEMHFSDDDFARYKLEPGDILLNEGQSLELVGRPAMFRGEVEGACFTNTLVRFRPGPELSEEYALIVFMHYLHSGQFQKIAQITTNLAHLGANRFGAMDFALPPLDEQLKIVKRCRQALYNAAAAREHISQLRTDTSRLIAVLTEKALTGQLSEQRVEDEAVHLSSATPERPTGKLLRPNGNGAKLSRTKRHSSVRKIIPVIDALTTAGSTLDTQGLFVAAGYPDDASVALVERFFLDIRDALSSGKIKCSRTGDVDFFGLASW